MKDNYDVLVVGGGIIGHSVAYSLSKRGRSVLVLEKGKINQKASSAAAGMLAAQAEVTEPSPLFDLARRSRNMFPSLKEELMELTNIDIELLEKGMLTLALTEEKKQALLQTIQFQKSASEQAEWLSMQEVLSIEPNLSHDIIGAMYAPNDGSVSAYKLASAFAEGARLVGATILENTDVFNIITENDRVIGVKASTGDFYGEHVVVTGGAWTSKIMSSTNTKVPIYPVKGECFSVQTDNELITKTIFSEECYIVPKGGGRYIVGATMIPGTYDEKVSVKGISQLANKAIKLLPAIQDAEWERVWAGIRPQTGDGLPYLGEHPTIAGLYVSSGHYRNGILLSPITGELVANMIHDQKKPKEIEAFSLDEEKRRRHCIEASY